MERTHTYSVVARDPATGDFGVAVQSHWFNVGRIVPWLKAGVGAVATQSLVEVSYGPRGLTLMEEGVPAPDALARLLADDQERAVRQVAMIDASGRVGVHTGNRCIAVASHLSGEGWSVQANIMRSADVVPAMAETFVSTPGTLPDRLLATLTAAESTGGDLRGSQSVAMIVVGEVAEEPIIDLRVEDHPDPIGELTRLVAVANAYSFMNQGDDALGAGDLEAARRSYSAAAERSDNPEILFWQGLGLAQSDDWAGGLHSLRSALTRNPDLSELLRRLPASGLVEAELASRLLSELEH